ncbi:unnamed protein product [Alternaria burnsii]|nr:unnamed protein product [Alternaria burnsii]
MALKHLLNNEDAGNDYQNNYRPHLQFNRDDDSDQFIAALPTQSWDQYLDDLLGSQIAQCDLGLDKDQIELYSSFQETSADIEDWTTGDACHRLLDKLPPEEAHICYGMVFRAAVRLCGNMIELNKKLNMIAPSPLHGHSQLGIIRPGAQFLVAFSDGAVVGEVNAQLDKALTSIAEQGYELELEVFAPTRAFQETIGRATREKEAVIRVQVNVYGPSAAADEIGRELSQHKLYLQRPAYIRDGARYSNPHMLTLPEFEGSMTVTRPVLGETVPENPSLRSFKNTIRDVYSSLTRDRDLSGLEGDERLNTTLLLHQKTALAFMMQREDGPIPEKYTLWKAIEEEGVQCYRHAVSNARCGGILADEMGMGKTLSILALIIRTLNAAHSWKIQNEIPDVESSQIARCKHHSGATLIVASSDLMINEWFQELDKHFNDSSRGVLKVIKYHGPHRHTSADRFVEADIVITTYHTLASDLAGIKGALRDIEWYRLVLDEAHIIRRQSTVLYRTVAEISARSRWCLTGTPIQNRLEDIGSLFAFLRISPFHSLSNFRKCIAIPFDEGSKRRSLAIERFTRLLDSLCLRRTKDVLHLPDEEHRVRKIRLSSEEQTQYKQTYDIMFRTIKNQNGVFDQKSTLGMFQVQLQLRIICNHGTWQQPFSWNRRKLHLLDEREAVEASLGRDGELTCSACRQTLPLFNTECLSTSMTNDQENLPSRCPLCQPLWDANSGAPRSNHASQEDTYFRPNGRSSKMECLMEDVSVDVWNTKSIIFTCWTRTLDLLQFYLRHISNDTWTHERIDGECSTAKRKRILQRFAEDPNLRVLIMTTGTGAVGLNLATANRVFIVEPQWNPSVENQAVARALRLGQKQTVLVTRYVVEQTVEQDMRSLQNTKLERANLIQSG